MMDRLREALERLNAVGGGPWHLDADSQAVLAAAARAVAEAETVTICATHRWPPLPSVSHTCMKGLPGAPSDPLPEPCSMVERLLVDPGKLQ